MMILRDAAACPALGFRAKPRVNAGPVNADDLGYSRSPSEALDDE